MYYKYTPTENEQLFIYAVVYSHATRHNISFSYGMTTNAHV